MMADGGDSTFRSQLWALRLKAHILPPLTLRLRYPLPRRDGGVVDRVGLENRKAAMSQGFESPSLLHAE